MAGEAPYGTKFKIAGAVCAGVTNISGPNTESEMLNASDLNSPDNFEEFVQGLIDAGGVDLELNFVPSDAGQIPVLQQKQVNRVPTSYSILWSDGVEWPFSALVQSIRPGAQKGQVKSAQVSLKLTGKPGFMPDPT